MYRKVAPVKQKPQTSQNGQSQVEYALLIALVALVTVLTLVLLGPKIGDVFSQIFNPPTVETSEAESPGQIVVKVVDADGLGIANVRAYAFNEAGRYLGNFGNTGETGELTFNDMAEGGYKFRADYQGKQFWSPVVHWPSDWLAVIETGQRPFTLNVVDAAQAGVPNVRVYAFTDADHFIGLDGDSDSNGQIVFNLADGSYKFRANYREQEYWSNIAETPATNSTTIATGQQPFTVQVIDARGNGIDNVRVYAFSENDQYAGLYGSTDSRGNVVLDLPAGTFKFRADYRKNQYWSDPAQTPAQNSAVIQTNQSAIEVQVINSQGQGIGDMAVYAFTPNGDYVGVNGQTDAQGRVSLDLPEGPYKFRANYQAGEFWSGVVTTRNGKAATIEIKDGELVVRVVDESGQPQKNVQIYVFTESGDYIGVHEKTDNDGLAQVSVPPGTHKIRADYKGSAYWSATFDASTQTAVTITTSK